MESKMSTWLRFWRALRKQFLLGILAVVPIGAAVLILIWLFRSIDSILQPIVNLIWGHDIPGVGFVTTLILIYIAGVIASNITGKRLIGSIESLLARMPVFGQIYTTFKQFLETFSKPQKSGFNQVVLVDFPRKGLKAIGFITGEVVDKSGGKMLSVLIPTAPNPTTGFLELVPESEITRTNMRFEDAIKIIISAGAGSFHEIHDVNEELSGE